MSEIKNLLLDLGGVVLDVDYHKMVDTFKSYNIPDFDKHYTQKDQVEIIDLFEEGKCTIEEFRNGIRDFRWAYLYRNQKQEVFLDSHVQFFEMVKGNYKEVVYDNMRNVVSKFIGKNDKELNKELIKLSSYYGFQVNVTNCFKGNEKGHVEGSVKIIRNKVFAKNYRFINLNEARDYLNRQLLQLNKKSKITEEMQHLLPHKPKLELADITKLKVNKYSFVQTGNNFYSVPEYLVEKTVTAKIYYDKVIVFSNDHFVCEHKKIDGSHQISIDIKH